MTASDTPRHGTAVVTGVTSGIGLAVVERLVERGWSAIGLARDQEKLERLEERAVTHRGRLRTLRVDLVERAARSQAFAALASELPAVDLIVHNAAACTYETPLGLPSDALLRLFEVNLFAGIELVQSLAPKMASGAHVVAISSVTTRFLPSPRFAAYAATKTALEQLASALRLELDPRGVRVTTITPGLVDTPIYDKIEGFDRARAKLKEQVPRWLSAGDVADAVLWAVERPPHVVVSDIVIMPAGQGR